MNEIRRKSGTYGTMFNCGLIAIKAHSRGVAVFCDWGGKRPLPEVFFYWRMAFPGWDAIVIGYIAQSFLR